MEKIKEAKLEKQELIFTKEQLILSDKYKKNKDIIASLLQDNKSYTLQQVDNIIKEFMKRSVK